ncbi:hypothetical protein KAJ27_20435, partial [bacterium]|nr:hypothetical protein [bacterium]
MKQNELINKANNYIGGLTSSYYRDVYHIANPVFERNRLLGNFFDELSFQEQTGHHKSFSINKIEICKKLFRYYFRSLIYYIFFIIHFFCYKISNLRYMKDSVDPEKELILINTYTMIDKIYPAKKFKDNYFLNVYDSLEKRKKQYVILAILFGDRIFNLRKWIATYNILAKDRRNFITEFEILSFMDYLQIFHFILVYPLKTLKLLNIKYDDKYDDLFKMDIVNTLDQIRFQKFVYYLIGKKINRLNPKIKVITWFENQAFTKLFFKGIRQNTNKINIIGTQFFNINPHLLHLTPLESEKNCDVVPDVIIVKSDYFVNKNTSLLYKAGIAPRENYLYDLKLDKTYIVSRKSILLLLTYMIDESQKIIDMVKKNIFSDITVKLHPNHILNNPFEIPESWKISEDNLPDSCMTAGIVISSSNTGASIEAACMGTSVLFYDESAYKYDNFLNSIGKDSLWSIEKNSETISDKIQNLLQ